MSDLTQELRDLQAVCERFGVDDGDALYRAADSIEELEAQLANEHEAATFWQAKHTAAESVIADVKKELPDHPCYASSAHLTTIIKSIQATLNREQ